MPAVLLEDLIKRGGKDLKDAKQGSVAWFFRTVRMLRKDSASPEEKPSRTGYKATGLKSLAGQMVAFSYDPKWKKKLPYYDRYPLVIPLSLDSKSMLGLNLHYLPPKVRLTFIRALQELTSTKNGVRKFQLSYQMLKSAKALSLYAPCLKRYLHSHVRSKLVSVDDREWEQAVLLPLARFEGASESTVWADSMAGRRGKKKERSKEVRAMRLKKAARMEIQKAKRTPDI